MAFERNTLSMQHPNYTKKSSSTDKLIAVTFLIIGVVSLLIVRGALFYNDWGDYSYFLHPWVTEFRSMSFIEGLGTVVGNYNPPYMYILNIIARVDFYDLYLIKAVSVGFDILLAYFVMKIVSLRTERINMHVLAFLLAFAIPTVILNSSMWGQCDSIYAAFAIGSVYFGLSNRSKPAYVFMALAFSFKFQAVFLMPVFVVFIFTQKIRFRDCYMFVIVYLLMLLPAVLAGMPAGDALLTYYRQAGYYSSLNMNIANAWQFVGHVDFDAFLTAGIFMTGLAVLGLLYFTFVNKERLVNTVDFVRLAYLFAVIMPFLLPKMHDRYYFLADVLSVLVFLFDKRRWFVPVVTVFCSYLGYAYLLMAGIHVIDYRYAAIALLFVILVVLRDYVVSLSSISDDTIANDATNISN